MCDGILLDLGVSSPQLDDPARGFTYRAEAELDLRFDRDAGEPAWRLLARLAERELADLIWRYGEERRSRRIAAAIVAAGAREPLRSTTALRAAVESAVPARAGTHRDLSRVFQALRIAVNGELEALAQALAQVPRGAGRRRRAWSSSPITRWKTAWSSSGWSGRTAIASVRPTRRSAAAVTVAP